jgi:hypothetical protein
MKSLTVLFTAAASLLLASCASPVAMRIERNPDIYNNLSERHKSLVARGEITEGMSKQAVFIAWGRPDRAFKGSRNGRALEQWSYLAYDSVPGGFVGGGYGYGYGGWYGARGYCYDPFFVYQPMISYVPYERGKVEFTNAKVSAWKR